MRERPLEGESEGEASTPKGWWVGRCREGSVKREAPSAPLLGTKASWCARRADMHGVCRGQLASERDLCADAARVMSLVIPRWRE